MEPLIGAIIIAWVLKQGWESLRTSFGDAHRGYITRLASDHPDWSERRRSRAARWFAVSYHARSAWHGFPGARAAIREGWLDAQRERHELLAAHQLRVEAVRARLAELHAARKAHAEETRRGAGGSSPGKAAGTPGGDSKKPVATNREPVRDRPPAGNRKSDGVPRSGRDVADGRDRTSPSDLGTGLDREPSRPTHVLTVRSKTGQPVNPLTGEATDSCAVYGDADLRARLAAAANNPDLETQVRRIGPDGFAAADDPGTQGREPGDTPPEDSGRPAGTAPVHQPNGGEMSVSGEAANIEAARTSLASFTQSAAELAQAAEQMGADLAANDLDNQTLADVAALMDKAQELQGQARQGLNGLNSRHQVMEEAHSATPHPAKREFYQH